MKSYNAVFKQTLIMEKDEELDLPPVDPSIPAAVGDIAPIDPALDAQAAAGVMGGDEGSVNYGGEGLTPPTNALGNEEVINKYIKAQEIAGKLDAALVKQLVNRIEEIDQFVERLGGLSEDSLLSILKKGAESNENMSTIYEREHRSIGKAAAALSALAQNLKAYI